MVGQTTPGQVAAVDRFSRFINIWIERVCGVLVALMALDVLFGILTRYVLKLPVTWTEELARYIMIWTALLAVSCGVYHREHIGLELILRKFPLHVQRYLSLGLDTLGLAFFIFLLYFGVGMTAGGTKQYATIFGMTMALPFASVPVSAALAALQLSLRTVSDFRRPVMGQTA